MKVEIQGTSLLLQVEKGIYNEDVLHKCFYWYTDRFSVDIESFSDDVYQVRLTATDNIPDSSTLINKIKRDLIDFKLRDIVTKETQTIRELITAKAFAYDEQANDPVTEVSDPVGFSPKSIGS